MRLVRESRSSAGSRYNDEHDGEDQRGEGQHSPEWGEHPDPRPVDEARELQGNEEQGEQSEESDAAVRGFILRGHTTTSLQPLVRGVARRP